MRRKGRQAFCDQAATLHCMSPSRILPQLGRFLDEVYMYMHIHSPLGYLTPAEFEQQWLTQQAEQSARD